MSEFEINEDEFVKLKDKVAIITGGSSGMGLATAELFAAHGAHVINADLNPPLETVPGISFTQLDVTSWKGLLALFEDTYQKYGRIDIVYANAGIQPTDDYLTDKFDSNGQLAEPAHRTVNINLISCINTVKLAVHYLRKGKGGSIIMTASTSSYQRFITPDYSSAKHGVLGFMRALVDLLPPGPQRITVNAVAPSWTATAMMPKETLGVIKAFGVAVQPSNVVAKSVALLAVDSTRHGQCIHSNGGRYIEVEEPILETTAKVLKPGEMSDGEVAIKLRALATIP